jgi:peptidoglycan/xylan/chitin deacetylase (PgdA/CDA1 family)
MTKTIVANIKSMLGYTLYATPWPRFFFRDKFLVTAFHRVNRSTLGDGVTCSPESFRSICIWLAKNFRVIPLSEQIDALEKGHILPRTASITFDDGYLDNFEIAAPILRELGLPATFFVATDLIESQIVPAWDHERGTDTKWMTWEHVRELARQGFDIESHTCTHIDLGTADAELARQELHDSIARLTRLLGSPRRLFAYPFGGLKNITETTRELVRQEGYRCCLSCYGGINSAKTSAYSLCRVPINEEYRSPYQLGLEILRESMAPTTHDSLPG